MLRRVRAVRRIVRSYSTSVMERCKKDAMWVGRAVVQQRSRRAQRLLAAKCMAALPPTRCKAYRATLHTFGREMCTARHMYAFKQSLKPPLLTAAASAAFNVVQSVPIDWMGLLGVCGGFVWPVSVVFFFCQFESKFRDAHTMEQGLEPLLDGLDLYEAWLAEQPSTSAILQPQHMKALPWLRDDVYDRDA